MFQLLGKNFTTKPVYVVLTRKDNIIPGHDDITSPMFNNLPEIVNPIKLITQSNSKENA